MEHHDHRGRILIAGISRKIYQRADDGAIITGNGHPINLYITPSGLEAPDHNGRDEQDCHTDCKEPYGFFLFGHLILPPFFERLLCSVKQLLIYHSS